MESPEEQLSRVKMMASDNDTWDLSPNDQAALRHVVGLVESLAYDLATAFGSPVGGVLRFHGKTVESLASRTESD
jgi:hypothetical protein